MNRRMTPGVAAFLLVACWVSAAQAGPFGLSMGMKKSDFQGELRPAGKLKGSFVTTSVPNPHDAFAEYQLLFSEKHGLCKVAAHGKPISTSVYGSELLAVFDGVLSQLSGKYGPSEKSDFLRAGSIWNEPKDWMMSLLKKERFLSAYWGQGRLPDDIKTIMLDTKATSTESGHLTLIYEFRCWDQYREEQEKARSDAL